MPIYEYRCGDCEQIFEEWQTDFKERELPCPVCGGKSRRLISNTSFVLKGTGWYTTDYCRTSSGNGGAGGKGNGNGSKSDSDAKPGGETAKAASDGGSDSAASGTAATSSGS